jgi:small multidrug resistance pump
MLKLATGNNSKWWLLAVAAGYLMAFSMLGASLAKGVPLGIAYAIWAGVGIVLIAFLSSLFFKEGLTVVQISGIALVTAGVICLQLGKQSNA